jgi:hypothetical protein
MRTCTTTADCAVVTVQQDCCGRVLATGVNQGFEATAKACAVDRAKGFAACECVAQGGTVADDGTTSLGSAGQASPTVACSANVPNVNGICMTSFASAHPFSCGPYACNSGTQVCRVVNSPLPGHATSYSCDTVQGKPSCSGAGVPVGSCGCAESANGEVTITECPP